MKTDSIPAALNPLTKRFIGCVIEVHRQLGPGLRKSTCEAALAIELEPAGIRFTRQAIHPVTYKGREIAAHRLDLLVEEAIVVELKSVERHDPLFEARLLTYLRISGKRDGLLMNFNPRLLEDGIKRMTL